MTKDVVCGMNVNESVALQTNYKGKTYYFCSAVCKSMFERDPEKYASSSDAADLNGKKSERSILDKQ